MSPEVLYGFLRIACPRCRAEPGEHCRTPRGAPVKGCHNARVFADLFKETPTS